MIKKNKNKQKNYTYFVHKWATFQLQIYDIYIRQPSNTINQYFPYYRTQTGNMGPYYPFEDKLVRATLIHTRQTRYVHFALQVFTLNAQLTIY